MPNTDTMFAPWFALAESTEQCWGCKESTKVVAIVLPDLTNKIPDHADLGQFICEEAPCALTNVVAVNETVESFLSGRCKLFFPDYSQTASVTYWMNHCEHCSAKIGDFYLHKPGHAFFPMSVEQAMRIRLTKIDIAIEADAGWSQSSWIDEALESTEL